jgi:hypothetical protein
MVCPLPFLNLKPEFTDSNDTRRNGLAAASVTNIYGNVTANVCVGFQLDGYTKYVNTSKTLPQISFNIVEIDVVFDCANERGTVEVYGDRKVISIKVCFTTV